MALALLVFLGFKFSSQSYDQNMRQKKSAYHKLFFCLEIFQYELWLKE